MTLDEHLRTVEAALEGMTADADTIEANPGATIVPRAPGASSGGALARLLGLDADLSTSHDRFELRRTIGEGGMGVVRLATQRVLDREVAVKTLKPDHRSEAAMVKLLREAWATGSLEHPNVVPVYDIGFEEDGSPLIVLKKIEGAEWATFIHDSEAVRERFGAEDLLEWNLQILIQVCNALRFAHSRGILHRDVKPENVMIGSFGEVYLVDWGLAVSVRDDGRGRLPLASETTQMAGTPLYMAPEMLGGVESRLSERTDVYLVGALLYELVTGRPPHEGGGLMQIVASIVRSEPELPPGAPEGLTRIVRRAMAAEPGERFESVERLQQELRDFLRHREALRLAEIATLRLERLEELLATEAPERNAVYEAFGECRFGFRQALEVWPENTSARVGLDRAFERMVSHELGRGDPETAGALLAEMRDVPEALAAGVAEARRAREQRDEAMRKLSADLDPSAGGRGRYALAVTFGIVFVSAPLFAAELERRGTFHTSRTSDTVTMGAFLIIALAVGVWARRTVMRTALNRRLAAALLLSLGTQFLAGLVGFVSEVPRAHMQHQSFLGSLLLLAMLALSVDWRLAFTSAAYGLAYVLLPFVGFEHFYYLAAATNVVLLVNTAVLWGRLTDGDGDHRGGVGDAMRERGVIGRSRDR